MSVTNSRTGRDMTTKYATTAFGADRETVDEAYPGDVVGLVNASGVQHRRHAVRRRVRGSPSSSRRIPRFAPEVFATRPPARQRQGSSSSARASSSSTRRAWCRCCATPTWATPRTCSPPSASCSSRCSPTGWAASSARRPRSCRAPYQAIRLTDKQSAERLRQIGGIRILTRGDGALVALFENRYRLQRLTSDEPELTLEPILADTDR